MTFGVMLGIGFCAIAAHRTPLSSPLYRETAISMFLGMSVAMAHPFYTRQLYLQKVSVAYDNLILKFEKNPELEIVDSHSVVKNFGATENDDPSVESEQEEAWQEYSPPGIFDGDIDEDKKYYKNKLMEML